MCCCTVCLWRTQPRLVGREHFCAHCLVSCCACLPASLPSCLPALQASCYNIGGAEYVLDDLENGILRGNAPGAASLGMLLKLPWLSQGPFKAGDPRAQHVRGTSRAEKVFA